jgi:hypothetical protein
MRQRFLMKTFAMALLALVMALPLAAQANSVTCLPTGQDLMPLPEAKSDASGILRATVLTTAEQVRMPTGTFGTALSSVVCYPQWVREYRLEQAATTQKSVSTDLANPLPGPVLRAKIGDLVEITFLNQIDPNKFPNSDKGCDQTSTYPGPGGTGNTPDVYPDCFGLSTTTNMHYHGTHTNPSSTGDNVFLEIKPSPRSNDTARVPRSGEVGLQRVLHQLRGAAEPQQRAETVAALLDRLAAEPARPRAEPAAEIRTRSLDPERRADQAGGLAAELHRELPLLFPPAEIHRLDLATGADVGHQHTAHARRRIGRAR